MRVLGDERGESHQDLQSRIEVVVSTAASVMAASTSRTGVASSSAMVGSLSRVVIKSGAEAPDGPTVSARGNARHRPVG